MPLRFGSISRWFLGGVWLLSVWTAVQAATPFNSEPLKVDLLGVFAHPDDETGVAATLAHYALGQNKAVAAVYCTRGEGGGNMVGTQSGEALGILREAELRACLQTLGVKYCYFLDRKDFAYTESLLATLQRWNREDTLRSLVRYLRVLRPEVILTMDPAPVAGQHGNHQAAGLLATEAFTAAADARRFPEQLTVEGLSTWQCRKLYYRGGDATLPTAIATSQALPDGRLPWQIAAEAIAYHRSQAFGNVGASPWMRQAQLYRPILSVLPPAAEDDLFRGLPTSRDQLFVPDQEPAGQPGVRFEFQSRGAISNYHRWVREQKLERVARRLTDEVSVVAGEANEIKFNVRNPASQEVQGEIRLSGDDGWVIKPTVFAARIGAARQTAFTARVTPPAHALGTSVLHSVFTSPGVNHLEADLLVNTVPLAKVRNLADEPTLDGSGQGWEGLPVLYIPYTQVWEGKSRDAQDSSAEFRLGVHGRTLYLDVLVHDDQVVTNIAPNDIKGHWRSDSVEICLDASAGAENSFSCYKLGVFPFDTTGHVKAARDADAKPGPAPLTAPKTRLSSLRTADGYRIQAAIPFSEFGLTYARRIGFNLLIYDGDKVGAALGENINKSRLAWAPRSGVQGRPEDWGRLDLD